jgi:hypothetical protein
MFGKVNNRRDLRPKVSMVQIAGCHTCQRLLATEKMTILALTQAKTKLTRPNPKLAMRALRSLAPACLKTVEL